MDEHATHPNWPSRLENDMSSPQHARCQRVELDGILMIDRHRSTAKGRVCYSIDDIWKKRRFIRIRYLLNRRLDMPTSRPVQRVTRHLSKVREALYAVVSSAYDHCRVIGDQFSRRRYPRSAYPRKTTDSRLMNGNIMSGQQVWGESATKSTQATSISANPPSLSVLLALNALAIL